MVISIFNKHHKTHGIKIESIICNSIHTHLMSTVRKEDMTTFAAQITWFPRQQINMQLLIEDLQDKLKQSELREQQSQKRIAELERREQQYKNQIAVIEHNIAYLIVDNIVSCEDIDSDSDDI